MAFKKDSRRQRFGFFRFRRAGEARKAIQRLDGRTLRNYRIHVNMAKYRGRSAYWRNVTSNYDNYSCEIDSSLKTDNFVMVRDYGNLSSLRFESKELDDEVGVPLSEKDLLELVVSIDDREQSKGKDVANANVESQDNFSILTAFSDISMNDVDSHVLRRGSLIMNSNSKPRDQEELAIGGQAQELVIEPMQKGVGREENIQS
ncbi:hypothetical protein ERO13_A13G042150v2 [Gossypium hirsutum]|uniref:RRM domain-containing protein n=1 Tax=Gossypium mustelinum TaxID=34275 RepID=A0A5D2WEA0_GOSMU|nr:hypothetical protein ERO13_A13G042150v2 [Gossypium hirsutum]TYI99833.1 hypothetical protein E1A91_A13G044800v1 [Gossypium mustelinum]